MTDFWTKRVFPIISLLLFTEILAQNSNGTFWNQEFQCYVSKSLVSLSPKDAFHNLFVDPTFTCIGPDSNDILAFSFGCSNANTIYAASRDSGVYKTINGGINWFRVNNGIETNFIRSIATHPSDDDIVLAGTFQGLYRTLNGGEDWDKIESTTDLDILDIKFDSTQQNIVFLGTIRKGIFRSRDSGLSWQKLFSDTLEVGVAEIRIDPIDSKTIYFAAGTKGKCVYKSVDGGDTWRIIFQGESIISLAVDPQNSETIYLGSRGNGQVGDMLFISTDSGSSWDKIAIQGNKRIITHILIDNNDSNNIYLATADAGIFYSNDAGKNWQVLNEGFSSTIVIQLQFHALTNSIIYASTNGQAIIKCESLPTNIERHPPFSQRDYMLYQNFPNPFNSETRIKYQIPTDAKINISIYNILGQPIRTLTDKYHQSGYYETNWDGKNDLGVDVGSGVYFVKLTTDRYNKSIKLLYLK